MNNPQRVADAAAGVSVAFFGISLATAVQIVQIIAGLVAIAAGLCAARYHWKNTRK